MKKKMKNVKRKRDKYDAAVEYLQEHPREMITAWGDPIGHIAGCLFRFAGLGEEDMDFANGKSVNPDGDCIGCLTTIRSDLSLVAAKPSLTKAIRADIGIPRSNDGITVASLPRFARWQRRIDKELKRV